MVKRAIVRAIPRNHARKREPPNTHAHAHTLTQLYHKTRRHKYPLHDFVSRLRFSLHRIVSHSLALC